MSCSKYTLTNTGSSIVNFSYQRCDDAMWEYQVELNPNQTKTIWLLDTTYSTAFSTSIVEVDLGAFPPTDNGPTLTPTPTPTSTPYSVPFLLGYSTIPNQACTTTETSYYGTQSGGLTIEVGEFLYSDTSTLTPAINGYYSDGTILYIVSGGLGEVTSKYLRNSVHGLCGL